MLNEPFFFKPLMFERVWGGNNLEALYGKAIPPGKIIGESWEICDRAEAQSVVSGGDFEGWTLRRLLEGYPREILGDFAGAPRFPLLVKYVDADDRLSVQVHPDDAGALRFDDLGKSECWVVVHAEPGAQVVRGLKTGTTRAMFERAVAENRVEECLHFFEAKVGDVIALPPGLVHAIGKGLVVAEVQQNSDLTLRIYDYNRMGLDGKPRQLHVAEALDAIRFGEHGGEFDGDMNADTVTPIDVRVDDDGTKCEKLLKGRYFDLLRLTIPEIGRTPYKTCDLELCFNEPGIAMILNGEGMLGGCRVRAGMTGLVPACMKELSMSAISEMTVLLAFPRASKS